MDAHTIYFERLSAREGMTPQDPPRARIVGPYDERVMAFIREVPAHERAFDAEHGAWRVSLTGPARLSRLARVVNALDNATVSPAITAPAVSRAVSEYKRHLAPKAEAEREQAAGESLRVSTTAETVRITFDYHRGWVKALRDLPQWARAFNPSDKSWEVARHPQALHALAEQARAANFPAKAQQTLDALANERSQQSGGGAPKGNPTPASKSRVTPSLG